MARVRKYKNEDVSVSFHHIERRDVEDETLLVKITKDEFSAIYEGLANLLNDNNETPDKIEKLKSGNIAIIKKVEKIDDRKICGIFESSYWGHSFRNSQKGNISAESLNHRPFLFLLYLSKSGRVYLACQYLGNYGGYIAMKSTVETLFSNKKNLRFFSFNVSLVQIERLIPTEVIFNVAKQSESISGKNVYGQKMAVALKDKANSAEYQKGIKEKILSLVKNPFENSQEKIRRQLAKFLKDNSLLDIEDCDLEDCRVIAKVDNKKITIQIMDGSNYATRYPVLVPKKADGHPQYEPLKAETLKLLEEKIISRKENV